MIPHKQLANGTDVPTIGFGTWQLHAWEAKTAVSYALASGYRLIDTARVYLNESAVGSAIAESGIPREEIFVTTKLWNMSQGDKKPFKAFDNSLKRLKLDYIDLYLIHWPVSNKRLHSWQALSQIYESGKARAIGVSNYTVRHLSELLDASDITPAVNQIEFHPFIYGDQKETLDFCRKHGIAVEAYSPLAHGHRMNDPVLTRIAENYGKSVAQVLLRWAWQHDTIPIPKSSSENRIKENISIFDFALSEADMRDLNNLSDGTRTCLDPNTME